MALRLMSHLGRAKGHLQVVYDNEDFFVKHTIKMIDERVNGLTRYTDGAVYEDAACFRDRFGHSVPWFDMSTGGKTVLNVFYNPHICFSQCECGENACADLKNLTEGCIIPGYIVDYDGDDQCDVIVDDNPEWMYKRVSEVYT